MATKTLLTITDYVALRRTCGRAIRTERGELIVTPTASSFHNELRDKCDSRLQTHVTGRRPGGVMSEGVKLAEHVVRRPDVAFCRAGRLEGVDLDQVPMPVAPEFLIEIVSKHDRTDDLLLKVSQYLAADAEAVWLLYTSPWLAYRSTASRLEPEVRSAQDGGEFEEPEILPGFSHGRSAGTRLQL
jgi:Uma2 family endonuclease